MSFFDLVRGSRRVEIVGHSRPDGDCVGAMLGMRRVVECLGISEVHCSSSDFVYENFGLLSGYSEIGDRPVYGGAVGDLVIYVDCENRDRVFPGWEVVGGIVNIDHHRGNTRFGGVNIVDETASSTCEIVYQMVVDGCPEILSSVSTLLFMGLATDTAFFKNGNVGSRQFSVASDLFRYGVNLELVKAATCPVRSRSAVRLNAVLMGSVQYLGRIGWVEVRSDVLIEYGRSAVSKNLGKEILNIEGVDVGIVFTEVPDGISVSMRGRGRVDLAKFSKHFGGGGHYDAAGINVQGEYESLRDSILESLNRWMVWDRVEEFMIVGGK